MKINLTKNGLESIFQPWEVKVLEILAKGGEHTSGTLTAGVNTDSMKISQASVVGFLDELAAWGITKKRMGLGKGGPRGIHEFNHTMQSLKEYLAGLAENWAKEMRNLSSTKTVTVEEKS